jgi:hypothetical protein
MAATSSSDRGAGDDEHARVDVVLVEPLQERRCIGKDRDLVAGDDVQAEQLGIEEARRPGRRDDHPRADGLDVAGGPPEL